jgi:phosphate uptake regulator
MQKLQMKSYYRNVQQIGKKGSFIITLPKKWCNDYEIASGSELEIVIDQLGEATLLISKPQSESQIKQEVELPFTPLFKEKTLARAILQRYLDGFEIIRIVGVPQSGKTKIEARTQIMNLVNKLYGSWLNSTINQFEIHVSSEITSPHNTLQNLFEMTIRMIRESIEAYITNNQELAFEVEELDDEVDKLYFNIVRTVKTLLRNPIAATKTMVSNDFSLLESMDLRMIASYLENLADSAELIAKYIRSQTDTSPLPDVVNETLRSLSLEISRTLELSFRLFVNGEYRKAVETLPRARKYLPRIEGLRNLGVQTVVVRTLEESVECIIDICDLVGE